MISFAFWGEPHLQLLWNKGLICDWLKRDKRKLNFCIVQKYLHLVKTHLSEWDIYTYL